jgi:type III restriction enzyme
VKLRFESDLDYQLQAIEAVCDLFKGQDINRTEFTVSRVAADAAQGALGLDESALGIGNRLTLLDEEILANLQAVQLRNGLAAAPALASGDFTVEMETGTGKTYVYLRTVFELNKRFGFTKFVIVVPSVAIREGVAKTIEMTADHFRSLYAGAPMDAFVYDSAKLGQVRDFATASTIKIMIGTIGAFNKLDTNVFYTPHEKTGGEKPVDLVRATRPVLIVDEPQSVQGRDPDSAGAKALREMQPLCTIGYSATHRHAHHMVYRLDAIDAYERKLVKRIDVAGAEVRGANNTPYVRLVSVKTAKNRPPVATVELDVQGAGAVLRREVTVQDGDDLAERTGRDVYRNVSVGTIEGGKGRELVQIDVPGDVVYLRPGEAHGDVDRDGVVRRMIERTIREHFLRERAFREQGLHIKVLSLFFIDRVEHYRSYADDGTQELGKYGRMFEDEYRRLAGHPDFRDSLFAGRQPEPEMAHNGYFSIDKKGKPVEAELNASGEFRNAGAREAGERAFHLIMRDKERLLDEAEPLRFIFSHSALREGWDNPNVFQICTLREMGTNRERRQTIGRGLRLCVDAHGDRRRDDGLNVLTVIADESFEAFADGLQKQIEDDLGISFGTVAADSFAALVYETPEGTQPMGVAESRALFEHLQGEGLIDAAGKIQDSLRAALKDNTLVLPDRFAPVAAPARALLVKLAGKLDIRNADERRTVQLNKAVFLSEDFKGLWDRIRHRTTYRVDFDPDALIADAAGRIAKAPAVARAQLRWRKAGLAIGRGGVDTGDETTSGFVSIAPESIVVPDVLGELQNRTQLRRASIARILIDSGRLDDLKLNPAAFIDQAADLIDRAKIAALVDGVRYRKIGDDVFYAQELFEAEELKGYLGRMVETKKSVHDAVVYDSSTIERPFAEALDANEAVKVFAKLPSWFKVATPLGTYNPDWAVLVTTDGGERLYFVVETKGTLLMDDLRGAEAAKIACGKRHFASIARSDTEPLFTVARTVDDLLTTAAQVGHAA